MPEAMFDPLLKLSSGLMRKVGVLISSVDYFAIPSLTVF
jgi:hypothetical protein